MSDFNKQYKDGLWQNKRLKILRRDNWHCVTCNATKVALDVHHLYYEIGVKIWEYDDDSLVTLCRDCHTHIHQLKKVSGLIAFKMLSRKIDIIDIDNRIDEILNYF